MYTSYNEFLYPYPYLVNMYYPCTIYPYPLYHNSPIFNTNLRNPSINNHESFTDKLEYNSRHDCTQSITNSIELKDYGSQPFVTNITQATKLNTTYRTALWTGNHLQLTLMSINIGEDIGLEVHPDIDQFLRVEEGQGIVKMGDTKYDLKFEKNVYDDFAIIIPAGKWHNVINTGDKPLKLYSIYAPPEHPHGTIHETKAIAEAAEDHHHH